MAGSYSDAAGSRNRWPVAWALVTERVRQGGNVSDAIPDEAAVEKPHCRILRSKAPAELDRIVGIAGPAVIIAIAVVLGGPIISVVTSLLSVA